jgi:hypothetical protein
MTLSLAALQSLLTDENILEGCASTREAVVRLCVAFRESDRFPRPISYNRIGQLLGIDRKTVWHHWTHFKAHGLDDSPPGRPAILGDDQLGQVVGFALEQFYSMQPITSARLIWFIHREYGLDISNDTLRRALARDQRIKPCAGTPMEMQRVQVTNEALMEYYSLLQRTIEEVPTAFIWNMDEIGHSDWADAHQELVYVPSNFEEDHIPIPVNRAGKRITLVGCICLDGTVMKPMVVIPRHTVDNDLSLLGVSNSNCHICHQPNGFIDRELFET